jgi:predicted Rossmann-fold nucleotide-binding protein
MDETFEMITWRQLDLHAKPIIICDVGGWAQPFLALVEALIAQGFAPRHARDFYEVLDSAEAVVARLTELPVIEEATAVSRL